MFFRYVFYGSKETILIKQRNPENGQGNRNFVPIILDACFGNNCYIIPRSPGSKRSVFDHFTTLKWLEPKSDFNFSFIGAKKGIESSKINKTRFV